MSHPSNLPVQDILAAVETMPGWAGCRLYGLWVQYDGDGTGRARNGEVVVSVQFGYPGNARAEDGRGLNVRDAAADLLSKLRPGVPA